MRKGTTLTGNEVTRRTIMKGGLAIAGAVAAPRIVLGQASGRKVLKTTAMGQDTSVYDPVVSGAWSTYHHAGLVYDTLFAVDMQRRSQPQMVDKYGVSDDRLTWTFELRDGLRFHDGTEVTTADVIPSIRRFTASGGSLLGGAALIERVKDISAKDEKSFVIQFKEPFALVPDVLARNCYIMRKKEAETDPKQKIDAVVGSGPFKFNLNEVRPGVQYVYDRNPDYVPRKEAPDGMAGGKVVKLDRVLVSVITDQQTGVAAVQAGELDIFEAPPPDLVDQLSQDNNLKVDVIYPGGFVGYVRFNFLQPPFDNAKCCQAMLHIVKQIDYLKANFANSKYYRTCTAFLGCGTEFENDANTEWFKTAPDYNQAKQLLKEGGYDGRPVVLLAGQDYFFSKNSGEILAAEMRKAGINVQIAAIDWAAINARVMSKAPADQGGWNLYVVASPTPDVISPLTLRFAANGEKGAFGWPTNAKYESLRAKWADAATIEERKKLAREMQEIAWNFVPLLQLGAWTQPVVMRADVKGIMQSPFPWARAYWNVEKS